MKERRRGNKVYTSFEGSTALMPAGTALDRKPLDPVGAAPLDADT